LVETQKNCEYNSNFKDMLFWLSSKQICVFCFSYKTQALDEWKMVDLLFKD